MYEKKLTLVPKVAIKGSTSALACVAGAIGSRGKFAQVALVAAIAGSLTGCGSFSIGASEYSCPGIPMGVQCMSARDAYEATHNGNVPASRPDAKSAGEAEGEVKAEPAGAAAAAASKDPIIDSYVAPRLPDKPIPIRTPAQVMRIWIAPYEDTAGDLNTPGYVFTEVEARRWVVSNSIQPTDRVLTPLKREEVQISKAEQEGRNEAKEQRREVAKDGAKEPNKLPSSKK